MIARLAATIMLVAIALQPAPAAGVTAATPFGPPTIRLEASETPLATRQALIELPRGETLLALPLGELGVAAGDVTLEVMPDDCVRVASVRTGPDGARWLLEATREVEAALTMTYPAKGLSWALAYTATLGSRGSLDLAASLRVTNGLNHDLQDARLVGEFARATLSLQAGQAVTLDQPWLNAHVPAADLSRQIVYDRARLGEAPVEMLTIAADAPVRATALPAGTVRIYASPEAGGEFIAQASLPYTPPREAVELALGPASGVTVTRTLEETKEVDKRLDARNRVVLFDLLETWVLEVRNLRPGPVEMLIREHHEGVWKLEQCNVASERVDAETLQFELSVEPGQRREITFRIRHQNRQP